MSISIGAEYGLPEEDEERPDPESRASQRVGVEDDLNVKLQVKFPRVYCRKKRKEK